MPWNVFGSLWPLVEVTGMPVVVDRKAALRYLQELKARSTTQFKDELKKAGMHDDTADLDGDDVELDASYQPEAMDTSDEEKKDDAGDEDDLREELPIPGVVSVFLPQLETSHDRERTPRRRESIQSTLAPPTETDEPPAPSSPKRKSI